MKNRKSKKGSKIGGVFKVAPDQLNAKPGLPSETSKAIVAAMFAEVAAEKKKLHIISQKQHGDIFQRGDEFGYGPACEEDDLTGPFNTALDAENALLEFCGKCSETKAGCWKEKFDEAEKER